MRTVTLEGLPGIKRKKTRGALVRSKTAMLKALQKLKAACMADDNGALNIWIDDNGDYRGERCVRCTTAEAVCFRTKKQLADWLGTQVALIA